MHARLTAAALFTTLVVTGGALAAQAARDPKPLALRLSDVPAGARRMSEKASDAGRLPNGASGRAYQTTYQWRNGAHDEVVTSAVVTLDDPGRARAAFTAFSRAADARPGRIVLRLPAYADEQYAAVVGDVRHDAVAVVVVGRRGSAVWQLSVSADPLRRAMTRAEAVAEMRRLAPRQQQRVGGG